MEYVHYKRHYLLAGELLVTIDRGYHWITAVLEHDGDERAHNDSLLFVRRVGAIDLMVSEALTDPPDGAPQFVEVYNPSGASVDVSSLALIFVNRFGNETMRVTLASAGELPAGGFLVAAAPSVVVDPGAIELPLPGSLSVFG